MPLVFYLCLQHFVDALSFDENPVEYLLNRFPESGLKPEVRRRRATGWLGCPQRCNRLAQLSV
jgi:hypothetical protein